MMSIIKRSLAVVQSEQQLIVPSFLLSESSFLFQVNLKSSIVISIVICVSQCWFASEYKLWLPSTHKMDQTQDHLFRVHKRKKAASCPDFLSVYRDKGRGVLGVRLQLNPICSVHRYSCELQSFSVSNAIRVITVIIRAVLSFSSVNSHRHHRSK